MRRWTGPALGHMTACRLEGTKPLSEQTLANYKLYPKEYALVKVLFKISTIFIQENAFQYVCEMADILTRVRWVTGNIVLMRRVFMDALV